MFIELWTKILYITKGVTKYSRRGLFGGIFCKKATLICPQGPFFGIFCKKGSLNMPAGAFSANSLNPRRPQITFLHSRKLGLDESFPAMCCTSPELRSASSYGHFTAAKEFLSQCRIFGWYISASHVLKGFRLSASVPNPGILLQIPCFTPPHWLLTI